MDRPIKLLIKYRGSFAELPFELFFESDDFGGGFGAVCIRENDINTLINDPRVIYIQYDEPLRYAQTFAENTAAFYCRKNTRLDGTGVVIGFIDSYLDVSHPIFKNAEYYGGFSNDPHGTYTAGIAAQTAAGARIICIGVSGEMRASDIMRGTARLIELAQGQPLVINISYGTNSGSHRGDSLFEEYLDYAAQTEQTVIVAAAGNEGNAGRHFFGISDGKAVNAETEVENGDFSCGIWYDFADDFALKLTAPNNETYLADGSGSFYFHGSISAEYVQPTPYMSGAEIRLRFSGADKGLWNVGLLPKKLATRGRVNMWLDKNFFTSPARETTVTLPALARNVITVAAYDAQNNSPAVFSGVGPAANGLQKPDIAAPGVNIRTAAPNNGYAAVSGTSFAAPFVSGVCALLMQWGIVEGNDVFMYGKRLKAFLQKGARRTDGVVYPNFEQGFGTLCLDEILRLLVVDE